MWLLITPRVINLHDNNLKYIVIVKEFSNRKPQMMDGDIFKAGGISGAAYVFQIWEKKYLGSLHFSGSNSNTVGVDNYSEDSSSLEFDLKSLLF